MTSAPFSGPYGGLLGGGLRTPPPPHASPVQLLLGGPSRRLLNVRPPPRPTIPGLKDLGYAPQPADISFLLYQMCSKWCTRWTCKRRQPANVSRAPLREALFLQEPRSGRPLGTRLAGQFSKTPARRGRCQESGDATWQAAETIRLAPRQRACVNGAPLAHTDMELAGAGPCACAEGGGSARGHVSEAGLPCAPPPAAAAPCSAL